MDNIKEILKNQLKKLPKDIQDAILAVDLRSKMQFITKKNNLHIDQAEALENEAVFVLLGLEHPNNLIANIAKHAEVSEEKAEAIAEDLNREIFLKVRESLKKIFEERKEEGSSFLAGSLSADEAGLLGKRNGKETGGSLLGKTEEEELNREDILREIEDKEHHNLPSASKTEFHLEVPSPSEIVNLETKRPSEITPSGQAVFQNQKTTEDIKKEKPIEINFQPEQIQKKPPILQDEALRTMLKDIVKAKMGGTVSVPKETVEVGDAMSPPKVKLSDISKKIDPYREQVGK